MMSQLISSHIVYSVYSGPLFSELKMKTNNEIFSLVIGNADLPPILMQQKSALIEEPPF